RSMVLAIAGEPVVQRSQIRFDGKRWIEREHAASMGGRACIIVHHREGGGEERMLVFIGMADPAERLDRIAVATRHEKCPPKMAPKSLRVVRVEAHGLPDPLNAFFWLAQPSVQLALLDDDQVVVGIEDDRTLLMVLSSFVVVAQEVHGRKDAV